MFDELKNKNEQRFLSDHPKNVSAKKIREQNKELYDLLEEEFKNFSMGIIGVVKTTNTIQELNALPDGIYEAATEGTYANGLVAKKGYWTKFEKKGTKWEKIEVEMPSVSISGKIEVGQTTEGINGDTAIKYIQNKAIVPYDSAFASSVGYANRSIVYASNGKTYQSNKDGNKDALISASWTEIILNIPTGEVKEGEKRAVSGGEVHKAFKGYKTEVDQEFDETSENAISNKKVTKLIKAIKSFDDTIGDDRFIKDIVWKKGIVDKNGVIKSNNNHQYAVIGNLKEIDYVGYRGHILGFVLESDAQLFKHIIVKLKNGQYKVISEPLLVSKESDILIYNYKINIDLTDVSEIIINKHILAEDTVTLEKIDSVKNFVYDTIEKENAELNKLIKSVQSFDDTIGDDRFIKDIVWRKGIVDKNGVIKSNNNHQYVVIGNLREIDFILYRGHRLGFVLESDAQLFKHIIVKLKNGQYKVISEPLLVSKESDTLIYNYKINIDLTDVSEIIINKHILAEDTVTLEKIDSVKNFVYDNVDINNQIIDLFGYVEPVIDKTAVEKETIGVDLNYTTVSTDYVISANDIKTKGSGKIIEIRFNSTIQEKSRLFYLCKIVNKNAILINWGYASDVREGENTFKPHNWYCEKDCLVFTGTKNLLYSESGGGNGIINIANNNFYRLGSSTPITNYPDKPNNYIALEFDVDYTQHSKNNPPTFKSEVLDKIKGTLDKPLGVYFSSNNMLKGGAVTFIDDDTPNRVLDELVPLFINTGTPLGLAVLKKQVNRDKWVRHLTNYYENYGDLIEMLNHTINHRATLNTDNYTTQLAEIKGCDDWLKSLGINVTGYVSPNGRFNQTTLDVINEIGYTHHYRFDYEKETNSADDFYNLGIKRINFGSNFVGFPSPATLEETKVLIDQAVSNNEWLVITLHYSLLNTPTFWEDIKELINYCKTKNVRVLKPSDGFEMYKNIIEVDNGFRITKKGKMNTDKIPYSYR